MDLLEPLFDAIVQGEEQLVQMYLQLGADLKMKGQDGQSVLHWAAASQFGEFLVRYLVDRGADPDALDNHGYAPLHAHSLRGRVYGVSCLLQAGAVVNIVSPQNQLTPLHLAVLHNQIEVANILLAYGADASVLNANGPTAQNESRDLHMNREFQHSSDGNLAVSAATEENGTEVYSKKSVVEGT